MRRSSCDAGVGGEGRGVDVGHAQPAPDDLLPSERVGGLSLQLVVL